MQLEDEQYDLLAKFVEAHRRVPPDSRGAFLAVQSHGSAQASFLHPYVSGLEFAGSLSDAEVLADAGLLRARIGSSGNSSFSVLPRGIEVYETVRTRTPPVATIVRVSRDLVSGAEFKRAHAVAAMKWESAAQLLWSADSTQQLTTVGHLCREALQEFATSFARERRVDVSSIDPAKTVARLQAVIEARAGKISAAKKAFLSALVAYWGTVSDLVQRQEHGGQKEGEPLTWDDARLVVFQTCLVMFEVSSCLPRQQ